MLFALLADAVLVTHFAFVAFVIAGGMLTWRWPRAAWLHLPALVWGALIEFAGISCPLTPLENALRQRAGQTGYSGGFIEHYLTAAIYPEGLTRAAQIVLGSLLVAGNMVIYGVLVTRRRRRGS